MWFALLAALVLNLPIRLDYVAGTLARYALAATNAKTVTCHGAPIRSRSSPGRPPGDDGHSAKPGGSVVRAVLVA